MKPLDHQLTITNNNNNNAIDNVPQISDINNEKEKLNNPLKPDI